jgi:hypothetical protein
MSDSRTEIPIDLKGPANGFSNMNISGIGERAALRAFFGYPLIQDVANRFYQDHLSMRISDLLVLVLFVTSSSRTTTKSRKTSLVRYVHYCINFFRKDRH